MHAPALVRHLALFGIVVSGFVSTRAHAEVTAEKTDDKVTIKIDGQLFCEYLTDSGGKPIVWPILGPGGAEMTRSYPMKKVEGEETDHVHHRSLWFTHGDVNGVDFWLEGSRGGKQVHREFVRVEGGDRAVIVTRNDWVSPAKQKVCEDERRLAFFKDGDHRVIDFDIDIKALDEPLVFGDTKEGSFGIRVAESMRVERKKANAQGHIVNSENQTDGATWGKRAAWVDYYGPVQSAGGKESAILGIAILNHPSSFRHPTHWHVRTYGLFAANPFGIHDFETKDGKGPPRGAGKHTVPPGGNLSLRYRVIIHSGDTKAGRIAEAYAKYAAE
jgi:hypothetical protein